MALSKGRIVGLIVIGVVVVVLGVLLLTGQQGDTRPVNVRAFTRNTEIKLNRLEQEAVEVRDHFGAEAEEKLVKVDEHIAAARSKLQEMQNVSDQAELRKMRDAIIDSRTAADDILDEFK